MKRIFTFHKPPIYCCLALVVGAAVWWAVFAPDSSIQSEAVAASRPAEDAKVTSGDVRPELLAALEYSNVQDNDTRVEVAKSLPSDLNAKELEFILQFLVTQRPPIVNEGAHGYFFHELCNKLHIFSIIRANYAKALHQVAADDKQDAITRDYAIQHLRRIWGNATDDLALRQSIQATFWKLAAGAPTISASAVLSLHNLGVVTSPHADYSHAAVSTSEFQKFLDTVLRQPPSASAISQRMTAARIVGDRRLTSSSELLLSLVENEAEHMLVRTSAIIAMGKLGMKNELSTLSARLNTEPRLTAAFSHAAR